MELMLSVAREHPEIVDAAASRATFEAFGDNTLSLVLRCYMDTLENRLGVITDIHSEINRVFADADITIAFPQRGVHLDVSSPVPVRMVNAEVPQT